MRIEWEIFIYIIEGSRDIKVIFTTIPILNFRNIKVDAFSVIVKVFAF